MNTTNTNVTANAGNIATNTGNITANTTDIATNKTNIATNATAINTVATNTNSYLGGGANVSAGTAPTFTVQGTNSNSVSGAFAAVDTNLSTINTSLTSITDSVNNGTIGPVKRSTSDTNSLVLTASNGTAASPGNSQKLTNLAAGTLSSTSTDAVNGTQLNTTNTNVTANAGNIATNTGNITANTTDIATNKTNIATNATAINTVATNTNSYLGGGANVANGTAPTFTVQGTNSNSVSGAFAAVDSSFNSVNNSLTNITNNINNGTLGPVQRTGSDNLALVAADGTAASPGNSQKLTNLAAGTLSSTSTDAVNGRQLYTTNANVVTNRDNIATNTGNIQTLSDSAVKYDDSTTKGTITLGGAGGTKITNVTAGTLSATSTDAVNGRQLYTTNANVATNRTNIATNKADIQTLSDSAVKYDDGTTKDTITLGGFSGTKITNVTAGTLSATSTDAVNGRQLYTTNTNVATNRTNIATNKADIQTLSDSAVKYDDGTTKDTITLGGFSGTKITNVTAGTLSSTSTDAVNGAQLNATNTNVTTNRNNITTNRNNIATNTTAINTYLGGGTDVTAGTAPTFTVQGSGYNSVGNAFAAVDTSIDSVNTNISNLTNNINNGSLGPVRRTGGDNLALIAANGTAASPGNSQKLTNLAAGDLSATSTDAVNGSQLNATNTNVTQNATDIATNKTNIAANTTAINTVATNTNSYLGGGADVSAGTAPTFTVQGTGYNSVGNAFAAVDTSIDSVNTNIDNLTNNINNGSLGPVRRTGGDNLALIAANGTASAPGNSQKLTNLTAGTLSDSSTDAVNGSQLNTTNTNVTTNATNIAANATDIATNKTNIATNTTAINTVATNTNSYLGGGADVAAGNAPTFTVQGTGYNSVGNAFAAVDTSIDSVNTNIDNLTNNINNGSLGPVRRTGGDNLALIAADGTADAPGNSQKLTNLTAGTLSDSSTDAVNGAQLYATHSAIDANGEQMAKYLGGGASYTSPFGTSAAAITAPTYAIRSYDSSGAAAGSDYNNVGDAFAALDSSLFGVNSRVVQNTTSITTINNRLTDIDNGKSGVVQRTDDTTLALIDNDGGTATPQKLTNVAAGTIASGSTDAVNAGQLFDTNTRIDGIDTRVGNVENRVGNIEDTIGTIGDAAENAVKYDKGADGKKTNSVTLVGADASTPVALHNVAAGTVAKGSTDAVNGGQLSDTKDELNANISTTAATTLRSANDYTDMRVNNITTDAVDQANRYTDMRFDRLRHKIHHVRDEARSAAAIGLAAASLRFSDRPGKISFGVGGGYWKSEGAVSFGAGYTSETGRFRSNITGTVANSTMGIGGGLTFELN
ncbi:hypothetical protein DPQ22_04545 [Candidatus Tokpelaia sp.]|nr:hypothetical protein DPQ22_04545 [Candidatus Tokpelaia sp.]